MEFIIFNRKLSMHKCNTTMYYICFRDSGPAVSSEYDYLQAEKTFSGVKESFFEYLPNSFWENTAEMSNLYSVQTRDLKSINTSKQELIVFTGIEIIMGCLRLPQAKLYWSRDINISNISNHMTRNRYYMIRNHLHFVNNLSDKDPNNKLWKVQPLLTAVRNRCLTLPRSTHLSIDEQMIPFAGRCQFSCFVPSKPNPLGLKNFVLAASDGLILDYLIYTGKGTVSEDSMKTLGLGCSIVKQLCQTVPQNSNHVIYADRFFSSVKCADTLLQRNTYFTGTVMGNRTEGAISKLAGDKSLKRGEWSQVVRQDDNATVIKWKDNKGVLLLSTCVGSNPVAVCKRWSKENKQKIDVPQPAIVKMYNTNMGGIDLHDRLLSYYRSYIRTKKWPIRVFNHFVDVVIINCWIMYKRISKRDGVPKKDQLSLLEYRLRLGSLLILSSSAPRRQPSLEEDSTEEESEVPRPKYRKVVPQALPEVKYDSVGHLPKFMKDDTFASKCRMQGCKSRCRVICIKCKVYLCINNNCFVKYHTPTK